MAHGKDPWLPTQGFVCCPSFNHSAVYVEVINSRLQRWHMRFKRPYLPPHIPIFKYHQHSSLDATISLPQDVISCHAGTFCLTPEDPRPFPHPQKPLFLHLLSFFSFRWVSVWCTCVYVSMGAGSPCVYACACGDQRSVLSVLLSHVPLNFWGSVSLSELELSDLSRLACCDPWWFLSAISGTGIRDVYHHNWLFMWALWIDPKISCLGGKLFTNPAVSRAPFLLYNWDLVHVRHVLESTPSFCSFQF